MSADDARPDEIEDGEESSVLSKSFLEPLADFYRDSMSMLDKAHKPDQKEYLSVLSSTGLGLLIMGGLGYVVKLLHYPVKEILVGKMAS